MSRPAVRKQQKLLDAFKAMKCCGLWMQPLSCRSERSCLLTPVLLKRITLTEKSLIKSISTEGFALVWYLCEMLNGGHKACVCILGVFGEDRCNWKLRHRSFWLSSSRMTGVRHRIYRSRRLKRKLHAIVQSKKRSAAPVDVFSQSHFLPESLSWRNGSGVVQHPALPFHCML